MSTENDDTIPSPSLDGSTTTEDNDSLHSFSQSRNFSISTANNDTCQMFRRVPNVEQTVHQVRFIIVPRNQNRVRRFWYGG